MARRQRDYKAEYRRRNEKAKREGYTGYYQKRKTLEAQKRSTKQTTSKASPKRTSKRTSTSKQRDYRREYIRRDTRARNEGFTGYSQKRKFLELAKLLKPLNPAQRDGGRKQLENLVKGSLLKPKELKEWIKGINELFKEPFGVDNYDKRDRLAREWVNNLSKKTYEDLVVQGFLPASHWLPLSKSSFPGGAVPPDSVFWYHW